MFAIQTVHEFSLHTQSQPPTPSTIIYHRGISALAARRCICTSLTWSTYSAKYTSVRGAMYGHKSKVLRRRSCHCIRCVAARGASAPAEAHT